MWFRLAWRVVVLVLWLIILVIAASMLVARIHGQQPSPKISPAQAAEILRAAPGLANWTNRPVVPAPVGPTWASTGARWPLGGPWSLPPWAMRVPNWYSASHGVPRFEAWGWSQRPTFGLNSPGRSWHDVGSTGGHGHR